MTVLVNKPEIALIRGARRHFPLFAAKAFNLLNPGTELIPTAAFLAIAHKLNAVARGGCRRLIINVPPRSGKSLLGSSPRRRRVRCPRPMSAMDRPPPATHLRRGHAACAVRAARRWQRGQRPTMPTYRQER